MNNRNGNIIAFFVLALLWLGFLAALALNPQTLDAVWQAFSSWPFILRILVGLLTLPLALALWAWQTDWAFVLRLLIVLGLAWASLYAFYPFKKPSAGAASPAS